MTNLLKVLRQIIAFFFLPLLLQCMPEGSTFTYKVSSPYVNQQKVKVTLRLDKVPNSKSNFRLYSRSKNIDTIICKIAKEKISISAENGLFNLEKFRGKGPFTIEYTVELKQIDRHRYAGCVSDDLVVFSGEQVLLLPEVTVNGSDSAIQSQIKRIIVALDFKSYPQSFIPFQSKSLQKNNNSLQIITPDFFKIYQLCKSPFVFGTFSNIYKSHSQMISAYADKGMIEFTGETLEGIDSLVSFYSKKFPNLKKKANIVFLPYDKQALLPIMGGVSMFTICSSFDPNKKRDWELLSHRLFHTFFDNSIQIPLFHKNPSIWFYEGLATYYENIAINKLPDAIRTMLKIDSEKNFTDLAIRYLQFRLSNKEMAISPMHEGNLGSASQIEFLHYTQAPLIIRWIEEMGAQQFGGEDRLLGFVLNHKFQLNSIEPIMSFGIVKNYDKIVKEYLFGNSLLPVWKFVEPQNDSSYVKIKLSNYQKILQSMSKKSFSDKEDRNPISTEIPNLTFDSLSQETIKSIRSFSPIFNNLGN